ncbi:MAG: hypothetical protein QOK00_3484, partial [Thermoleophilaceae bacterium]|nr:hypothetical protein [Thermoleophilaceae bacterium]
MDAVNGWRTSAGAGAILQLIRAQPTVQRAELAARTGMSRSTVSVRLEQLLAHGLISDVEGTSTGGRRPALFAFNPKAGVVLAAAIGASHSRLAVTDLAGAIMSDTAADIDVGIGPDAVLSWVEDEFSRLLAEADSTPDQVRGVGFGIPAPVEASTGRPVLPPIMPGWDAYPIPERVGQTYDVPILVDNDVNAMALGEQRTVYPDVSNLLFLKIGTGIGCGIVANGQVQRGADGSAGDLGHVHTAAAGDALCRCGKFG